MPLNLSSFLRVPLLNLIIQPLRHQRPITMVKGLYDSPSSTNRRLSSSSITRAIARPSSSVIILSPENHVILLHRVKTSSSFASAHVFPGGNLDAFHDGDIPDVDAPGRHVDGPEYRIGAIRETFEETGILLARSKVNNDGGGLVSVDAKERDEARKKIHGCEVKFGDWVDQVGGVPDTDNLIPFTRWITPDNVAKRFTTQMYLYLLPLATSSSTTAGTGTNCLPSESLIPTADGGVEHTAATVAPAQSFLRQVAAGEIIMFPPQVFLLTLLSQFLVPDTTRSSYTIQELSSQREKLLSFLKTVPTADTKAGRASSLAGISWADKCISPHVLFRRSSEGGGDGRAVLGLDRPGVELAGSERGGDWERVVLVRVGKGGPTEVEVRRREEVFEEERRMKKKL